jgi:hypothetical protein
VAKNPGFGGSITQDGMNNAKNIATPFIFQHLQDVKIPEVDITDGKFTNLDVQIAQPDLGNVNITMDSATNAIELTATGINAHMTSDFVFKYIISVSGQADITINNIGVDAKLTVGTQPGTPNTELAPALTVDTMNITINSSDVNVTLSGSAVAKIASVLIPLIKSSLIPTIVSQVESTAKTMIETTANQDLALYGTQITIPYLAGVTFDFSQMLGGPKVTTDNIFELAMDGTFFDINNPETYSFDPAAFPLRDTAGRSLQAYLTDYVVNTNLISAFDTGNALDISMILEKFGKAITTDQIGLAIPQILTKYGSGQIVTLAGAFVNSPGKASFTSSLDSITVNLAVTVSVAGETAISAEFDAAALAGMVNVNTGKLYGSISQHTIGTVSNFSTTLGIDAATFQSQLQAFFDQYISDANT